MSQQKLEPDPPRPSKRVRATDDPCIVTMQEMMRDKEGLLSLAQGAVHWQPPPEALNSLNDHAKLDDINSYGDDDGLPELRAALKEKLRVENGLEDVEVMVTTGANQAYVNLVLALIDASDGAVLFEPFYFNHMMALQMTGSADSVVRGRMTGDLLPDVDWLAKTLSTPADQRVRMVTLVNPGNPTGTIIPKTMLEAISKLCAEHGAWLVIDNTYEYFTYEHEGAAEHSCVAGDHVANIFSFSKAFGMMGWRVGYMAFPKTLKSSLLKVQDTIPICPCIASQRVALAALKEGGRTWVKQLVAGLSEQKKFVGDAVADTLGPACLLGGSGAIYLMARLPEAYQDDVAVVRWLADKHKICVIPGSACGAQGSLRISYANSPIERCKEAASRLRAGLAEIALGVASLA